MGCKILMTGLGGWVGGILAKTENFLWDSFEAATKSREPGKLKLNNNIAVKELYNNTTLKNIKGKQ